MEDESKDFKVEILALVISAFFRGISLGMALQIKEEGHFENLSAQELSLLILKDVDLDDISRKIIDKILKEIENED